MKAAKFSVVPFVILNLVQGGIINDSVKSSREFNLGNAVFKVMEDFYQFKSSIATIVRVIQPSNRRLCDDIIEEVLLNMKKLEMTVEVEDSQVLKKVQNRKRFSIIGLIDSTEKYLEYLRSLSPERIKFRKYFTIVALKPLTTDELHSIFEAFWKVFIKHVNIITQSNNSAVELHTFMPFDDGKCGNTQPVKINTFDITLRIWRHRLFHPTNKTQNLNQCTLVLGASVGTGEPYLMVQNDTKGEYKIAGIERDIFVVFSKVFNFKIKYRVIGSSIGNLYENGTATGFFTLTVYGGLN